MKRTNKFLIIGAFLAVSIGSGCKKSWFDINKDPNNAVESNITPDLVTPYALLNTANRTGTGYGFLGNWLGYTAPGANYAPGVEEQSYNITTTFQTAIFNGLLDNALDYVFMGNKAQQTGEEFYEGIARIMKSHNYAQLVDVYNDVPYFEGLQGLKNIQPRYDDGKTVYEDLVKQIDTGINLIKGAVVSENLNITAADIMFNGDQTKWVKFANTLKLRLLMHQVNRADRLAYVQAEIAKIVAEGSGFLGSGEDASVNPAFQNDKPNAYYASFGFTQTGTQATDFWRANVIVLDMLKANNDPRMGAFFKPTTLAYPTGGAEPFTQLPPFTHRGNKYGLPIDNTTYPYQVAGYVSQIGGVATAGATSSSAVGLIKGYNQRMWILTSVESLFLQAEAIQRGLLTGDAKVAYEKAVLESFLWLNIGGSASAATASFNSWYATQVSGGNGNVSYADAPNKLNVILFQKYLALLGTNNLETWNDYRRNGYPVIPLSVNPGRTSPTIPYRLLFPQGEINVNTANIPAVGKKSGDQFTKVWWMP